MNPNCYTNPGKGDIGKIYMSYTCDPFFLQNRQPPPPPPPPHTHTQHYASTQTSITQTQHNTVRIIIFPKHVLIQNLQASIRVEGELGTLAQIVVGLCHSKVKNGGFGASRAWNCRAPQHAQACKCGAPEQAQTWNGGSLPLWSWFVGSAWLARWPAVNPECWRNILLSAPSVNGPWPVGGDGRALYRYINFENDDLQSGKNCKMVMFLGIFCCCHFKWKYALEQKFRTEN